MKPSLNTQGAPATPTLNVKHNQWISDRESRFSDYATITPFLTRGRSKAP